MLHFKKQWLEQDRRERASATTTPGPARFAGGVPGANDSYVAYNAFPTGSAVESPLFPVFPMASKISPQQPCTFRRGNSSHEPGLGFARFDKYCPDPILSLQSQFSAESSAISNTAVSEVNGCPWLGSVRDGPTSMVQPGSMTSAAQRENLRTEEIPPRFMIDINKPPPSPTHSLEFEAAPYKPCPDVREDHRQQRQRLTGFTPSTWAGVSQSPIAAPSGRPSSPGLGMSPVKVPLSQQLGLRCQFSGLSGGTSSGDQGAVGREKVAGAKCLPKLVSSPVSVLSRELSCSPSPVRKPRTPHWAGVEQGSGGPHMWTAAHRVLVVERSQAGDSDEEDEDEDDVGRSGSEGQKGHGMVDEGTSEDHSLGASPKACLHCGTTRTPLWRNGPPGPKSLCNACGIRFNKIRSGKRKPTPKEASMLVKYERSGSGVSEIAGSSSLGRAASLTLKDRNSCMKEKAVSRDLPVAPLHRSRSKHLRHSSSMGAKKRCMQAEPDDPVETQSLRAAYPPRKRACFIQEEAKPGKRAFSVLNGVCISIPGAEGDASSSEHESCLSEPAQSPSQDSPQGPSPSWGREGNQAPCVLPKAGLDTISKVEDGIFLSCDDDDVHAGARLLMDIFYNSHKSAVMG